MLLNQLIISLFRSPCTLENQSAPSLDSPQCAAIVLSRRKTGKLSKARK